MRRSKGQAAMEFLMTYGWALLIVVIVGAVIFLVVRPTGLLGEARTGFTTVNVVQQGVDVAADDLLLRLQNVKDSTVNVTAIYVEPTGGGAGTKTAKSIQLSAGQTTADFETADLPTGISTGESFSYRVSIEYYFTNVGSGTTCSTRRCFNSSGTITGTA